MKKAAFMAGRDQLATLLEVGTVAGQTDGSLLDHFCTGPADRAQVAFAALVERHSPMVMQVCLRLLRDRHDAEDAAQATFLILARQARSIRRAESVASWLFGVAARVAAQARRDAARRRVRERRGGEAALANGRGDDHDPDDSAALYEELGRLPERFRQPVLLCHLDGLTYEQAAQRLGCPVRTIHSRLARARRRLRDRLARRGVVPAVAPLTTLLRPVAPAALGLNSWTQTTVLAAVRFASGGVPTGIVSTTVIALARGASRVMILQRSLKWAALLSLVGATVGIAEVALLGPSSPGVEERVAPANPPDDRFRVAMAGNTSIEVVAISTVPTGPGTWWRPDGTPLAEAPADAIEPTISLHGGEVARIVLVRASGLAPEDKFRWQPTPAQSNRGGRPSKNDHVTPGLEFYEATFQRDLARCGVVARVAAGGWKTEVSNNGGGGTGLFANGHKFSFGKARPTTSHGRPMTVFAVAHNFFGQDRRLLAIDRDGTPHPAVNYSMGSDGDPKWVIDLIDGEFNLAPELIREYQVQFRPFEQVAIEGIALHPQPGDRTGPNPAAGPSASPPR